MNISVTGFKPEFIPRIDALLDSYRKTYPKIAAPPAVSYCAPWTENGKNVICVFDETDMPVGIAPVSLSDVPNKPYTFWTAMRIDPDCPFSDAVREALLCGIRERAAEIIRTLPARESRIAFQYHPSEADNIDHVIANDGQYIESEFIMRCDLSREVQSRQLPDGIEIRRSDMTDEAEQRLYLDIRNKAFVEGRPHELANAAVSMEDFQILLNHVYRPDGKFILACFEQRIIGAVTLYVSGTGDEKTGITDDVFVAEEWRRRGIGSYLIREGLRYFQQNGLRTAQLGVNSANQRALELYERAGYVLESENPFYIIPLGNNKH